MIKNKRLIWFSACTACLILIMITFVRYGRLGDDGSGEEISTQKAEYTTSANADTETKDYESPIDFMELKKMNSDIYAWIQIPGTNVDYPIVQNDTDDEYYLEHTVDGKEGLPGSIYTYYENGNDFSAFNTIIYGHNMKNGSMFGGLKQFRDSAFFKKNQEIIIYTVDREIRYQIYAAVVFNDEFLLDSYPQDREESCQQFLEDIRSVHDLNSHINDIPVTIENHFITLSTCISGEPQQRFLIVAVEK